MSARKLGTALVRDIRRHCSREWIQIHGGPSLLPLARAAKKLSLKNSKQTKDTRPAEAMRTLSPHPCPVVGGGVARCASMASALRCRRWRLIRAASSSCCCRTRSSCRAAFTFRLRSSSWTWRSTETGGTSNSTVQYREEKCSTVQHTFRLRASSWIWRAPKHRDMWYTVPQFSAVQYSPVQCSRGTGGGERAIWQVKVM